MMHGQKNIKSFLLQTHLYLLGLVLVLNHPYIKRVATFTYYKRRWVISPYLDLLPKSCCSCLRVTTLYC